MGCAISVQGVKTSKSLRKRINVKNNIASLKVMQHNAVIFPVKIIISIM